MKRIAVWLRAGSAIAVLGACRDGSAPITPKELRISAGNNQTWPAAGEAPLPLRVTVIGSNDRPLADVPVVWRATIGSISLTPRGPRSDANGVAEAVVTLDAAVGPVEVQSTVSGLAPAVFHATTVDPCGYAAPHTFRGSSSGRLRAGDCVFAGGSLHDWYSLTMTSSQAVWIKMASDSLNAWAALSSQLGNGFVGRIAFDNDADTATTDAAFKVLLTAGSFIIAASSLDSAETGPYAVTSAAASSDATGCERMWVMRGVVTTQQLRAGDCVDSSGQGYADAFLVWLNPGEGVSLAQQSTAFRPYVYLFDRLGALIGEAGPGPDGIARLSHTATTRGTFFVFATSEAPGAEGAYSLTVATFSGATVATGSGVAQAQPAVVPPRGIAGARRWRLPTIGLER